MTTGASPPPRPRLRPLLSRYVIDGVVLLGVVAFSLFMFRWYLTARAQLIPVFVTPTTDFEKASRPSMWEVAQRMKDVALQRLGYRKTAEEKAVALTFDDGPYPLLTPALLDLLARNHIKATFFVIGRDAQMQPEILRRMAMEGHEIGNHSFTHASFDDLDNAGIRRELNEDDDLIQGVTGVRTRLARPPGDRLDPARLHLIQSMGYTIVLDNINPGDWYVTDPLTIYSYTLWHSINHAIVLLHNGRVGTLRALPTIIDAYRRKGYKFVTVSEMARLEGVQLPGDTTTAQR